MEDPQTNGCSKSRSAPTKGDQRKTATMLLVLVGSTMALCLKAARRRAVLSRCSDRWRPNDWISVRSELDARTSKPTRPRSLNRSPYALTKRFFDALVIARPPKNPGYIAANLAIADLSDGLSLRAG
jgi:hypothetical protein